MTDSPSRKGRLQQEAAQQNEEVDFTTDQENAFDPELIASLASKTMLRLSHALVLLLVLVTLMPESDGWLFWRKGRPDPPKHVCTCSLHVNQHGRGLRDKKNLDRRDVATILDVDEGDPLLAEVMQKRGGMVTKEELYDAAERANTHLSTVVKKRHQCHCGQKVLQHLGRSLE
ncbi:uncharacterized protein [Haliotis cracherodii]|uniref:uncharacterized protein n=1 Tax=Haliotis cracherodii TaxID=6455 RepID=UPI0039EA6651